LFYYLVTTITIYIWVIEYVPLVLFKSSISRGCVEGLKFAYSYSRRNKNIQDDLLLGTYIRNNFVVHNFETRITKCTSRVIGNSHFESAFINESNTIGSLSQFALNSEPTDKFELNQLLQMIGKMRLMVGYDLNINYSLNAFYDASGLLVPSVEYNRLLLKDWQSFPVQIKGLGGVLLSTDGSYLQKLVALYNRVGPGILGSDFVKLADLFKNGFIILDSNSLKSEIKYKGRFFSLLNSELDNIDSKFNIMDSFSVHKLNKEYITKINEPNFKVQNTELSTSDISESCNCTKSDYNDVLITHAEQFKNLTALSVIHDCAYERLSSKNKALYFKDIVLGNKRSFKLDNSYFGVRSDKALVSLLVEDV